MKRLLLAVAGLLLLSAPVRARDDWQFWQEATLPLWKRGPYQASLIEHARFNDDMSDLYFFFLKAKNQFRVHPLLPVSISYLYVKNENSKGVWKEEHRPELELSPALSLGALSFENRLRMEARLIEDDGKYAVWRYRHRFQLSYAFSDWRYKPSFFVNEEIFYDLTAETRNQNRFFAGVKAQPARWAALSLSWGVQSLLQGQSWESRQLLQASVEFKK